MPVTDATLVTILGMSVYSTYAYLPAYIHNVLVYFGYTEESQEQSPGYTGNIVTDVCLLDILCTADQDSLRVKGAIKIVSALGKNELHIPSKKGWRKSYFNHKTLYNKCSLKLFVM